MYDILFIPVRALVQGQSLRLQKKLCIKQNTLVKMNESATVEWPTGWVQVHNIFAAFCGKVRDPDGGHLCLAGSGGASGQSCCPGVASYWQTAPSGKHYHFDFYSKKQCIYCALLLCGWLYCYLINLDFIRFFLSCILLYEYYVYSE